MKNSEKIMHIEIMCEKAKSNLDYSKAKVQELKEQGKPSDFQQMISESIEQDYKALKYAVKALHLLRDLVNDEITGEEDDKN